MNRILILFGFTILARIFGADAKMLVMICITPHAICSGGNPAALITNLAVKCFPHVSPQKFSCDKLKKFN